MTDATQTLWTFLRRWFIGQPKPPKFASRGGQPPMPRPPEDRGKPS